MILSTWSGEFYNALGSVWMGFAEFTPNFVFAVVVFILGWFVGSFIAKAVEQVFSMLKVDSLLVSIGAEELAHRAGVNLNSGRFVGALVKWFFIIVFLLSSLAMVGLSDVSIFLQTSVLALLQQVIISAFVLVIAAFVAQTASKVVVASARGAGVDKANLLGAVAKYVIWIFAFVVVLDKLGLGSYMQMLFAGVVAMLALSAAIAFGLGGRDVAARFLDKVSNEVK